jgi:GTPase Era involved in 16S rRNA processing
MWLNRLLQLGFKTPRPTKIYEDNKAAILFSDNPGDHRRSKHIDTRIYSVRDAVLNGDILLEYIPTAEQLADGLNRFRVLNIKSYAWITIYRSVYLYVSEFNQRL